MKRNRRTLSPQYKEPERSRLRKALRKFAVILLYIGILISIGIAAYLYYLSRNLPELTNLIDPVYDLPTQVFDRNDQLIKEFYTKHRVLIPIANVPPVMIRALLAIEDARFYHHFGIDLIRIVKAFYVNISQMRLAQGASTLTQQTARMFLLSNEKKLVRKLKEILLALKIERLFTKDQILELYLNKYFFGHRAYGIEAAAQGYFNKTVQELTLAESALLAGLPQAPSKWAPTYSMANATRRRNQVLKRMADEGYIDSAEKTAAMEEPIVLKLAESVDNNETSYYVEHIRRYLQKKYGANTLYRGGMKVYINMDLQKQILAQNALTQGLIDHDRRQGYRGPIKNLFAEIDEELHLSLYSEEDGWNERAFQNLNGTIKQQTVALLAKKTTKTTDDNRFVIGGTVLGVVEKITPKTTEVNLGPHIVGKLDIESMDWARPVDYTKAYSRWNRLRDLNEILDIGDVIILKILDYQQNSKKFVLELTQRPIANGSIFAMDPKNGDVVAMSGGFDFRDSEFNRATQAKRQPGSSFKPVVYSCALDSSFTAASILNDSPLVFPNGYKPINFDKKFVGKLSLRDAIVFSKNVPTVRMASALGIDSIIDCARNLGISTHFPKDISISLGSASMTIEEIVRTYAVFANGGKLVDPVYIRKVVDRNGEILEQAKETNVTRVLSEDTAFLVTNLLEDVVRRGTGKRARAINRPSAGKTGTNTNNADAWYVGYVPQLVTGVYVGFDDMGKPLGRYETGARAAAPIWVDFMKNATAAMPVLPFRQPVNIQMVRINAETGLKECFGESGTTYEFFKTGSEPTQCHRETVQPPMVETGDEDLSEYETVVEEL